MVDNSVLYTLAIAFLGVILTACAATNSHEGEAADTTKALEGKVAGK
jgi:hypothetical protein